MQTKIFDVQHFSTGDGPGIRTTIFFAGCPLTCPWCHNPEGLLPAAIFYRPNQCVGCGRCLEVCPRGAHSLAEGVHRFDRSRCDGCGACCRVCPGALKQGARLVETSELAKLAGRDRAYYDLSGGGVTLSGGEPLAQYDQALCLARELSKDGIGVCLDTALGAQVKDCREAAEAFDLILADVKFADPVMMREICGGDLGEILARLEGLKESGANIILRQPYIPVCHDRRQLTLLAELFRSLELPVIVLPYHRLGSGKYAALGLPYRFFCEPPDEAEVGRVEDYYRSMGIRVMNRHDL